MQQFVCASTFEDTQSNAYTGTWGVRTRAITANNAGKLEWVERLILDLKGPMGQGGWQAVGEVHPAAAVPPGRPVPAH
ncbi:hypothetical protein WJX79_007383 [Trebouxia sp. C0005]